MKKLLLSLLLLPSIGFGSGIFNPGTGSGVAGGVTVYPATATASFPYGLSASTISVTTITLSGFPTGVPLYVDGSGAISARAIRLDADVINVLPEENGGTGESLYDDGEILIGNGSTGGLDKTTLTAGSNITITNGPGSIQIAASASGGSGGSPIAVTTGTYATYSNPAISSPLVVGVFRESQFRIRASGTTGYFELDSSSVTLLGNSIPAANIAAGTLGASVVASSITNASIVAYETALEGVLDLPDMQGQISDTQIANDAIDGGTGGEIQDGTITAADLGADSVDASELASSAIQSGDIESGDLPADGYASTYVNVTGDTMTGQLTNTSSVTVTGSEGLRTTYGAVLGSATISNLTSGRCVETGAGGLLTVAAAACGTGGGGGGSPLAITTGTYPTYANPAVSSPVTVGVFNETQFITRYGASGTTAYFEINGASVTMLGTSIDLSGAEATGVLAAARFPALTGDVTTSAGNLATTAASVQGNIRRFTNTVTMDSSFTVNSDAWLGTPGKAVTISSNAVTPGATFYQNGIIQLGSQFSASLPLQTDAAKNIVSSAIDASGSQLTGTLAAGRFPALTGDVTTSAGNLATTAASVQANIRRFTNTITVDSSFTVNSAALLGAPGQAVTISSNVITPGATFYQNGLIKTQLTASRCVETDASGNLSVAAGVCGTPSAGGGDSLGSHIATMTVTANYGIVGSTQSMTSFNSMTTSVTVTGTAGLLVNAKTDMRGGVYLPNTNLVTANYTVTSTDTVILASAPASTGQLVVTLPDASTLIGQVLTITKVNETTFTVKINGASGDVINGTNSITLNGYTQTATFMAATNNIWAPWGTGIQMTPDYIGPGNQGTTLNTINVASTSLCGSFYNTVPVQVDSMTVHIGTVSGSIDVGIYDNLGVRLASTGFVAANAAGRRNVALTSVLNLPPGFYWACLATSSLTGTFASKSPTTHNYTGFQSCTTTSAPGLPATLAFPCGNTARLVDPGIWGHVVGGGF